MCAGGNGCLWVVSCSMVVCTLGPRTTVGHPPARLQNSTLKQNYTHLVGLALDMSRTRVPDVLPDSLPNRNQLRYDSTQFIKRHLPGDHTTAKLGQVLHPRLLQGPAKTQHQEVDHRGDLQQSKNFLMSHTITVQEHISGKLPSIHKTMPVTAFVAEYPQNRRTDTTNADRKGG